MDAPKRGGLADDVAVEAAASPSGAPPAPRPALLGWLERIDRTEVSIVAALAVLCVLVKLLWLTHLDIYWDAGAKWHFVRQWSYDNEFGGSAEWSHHMARFGVNVPTYFVQLLFGTDPGVYHVVPIGAFTLQVVFSYVLARHVAGRATGVLAALIMIFFS